MNLKQKINVLTLNELNRQNNLKEVELRQSKKQADEQMEIEKQKLAVKDRVDISVKEYEEMKEQIKELSASNTKLKSLLRKLEIEKYLEVIDINSIEVKGIVEPLTMKKQVYIKFDTFLYREEV